MKIFPAIQPIESPQAISKRLPVSIWNPRIWTMNKGWRFWTGRDWRKAKEKDQKEDEHKNVPCVHNDKPKQDQDQTSVLKGKHMQ